MTWQSKMEEAVSDMLRTEIGSYLPVEHFQHTPRRVGETYLEVFSGCFMHPADPLLEARFKAEHLDQMVTVKDISFYSMCAHHFLPFFGYATFAYVPEYHIVGLSKIPRFIDILARRPQIQEALTQQIVNVFDVVMQPKGCAVMLRAYHLCCLMRGVQEHESYMESTALTGVFKTDQGTKAEFLQAAQATTIWGK